MRQLDAPPYFTFHYINSFETPDGAALVFDMTDFGDPAIINSFMLDNLRSHAAPLPLCSIMCTRRPPPRAHCYSMHAMAENLRKTNIFFWLHGHHPAATVSLKVYKDMEYQF